MTAASETRTSKDVRVGRVGKGVKKRGSQGGLLGDKTMERRREGVLKRSGL